MINIDEVYHNLTGVDIATQQLLWDERGKGYYGEYLVFKNLYPKLTGHCKILMNLEIPTGDGRTTEIDLLLIHETGLYVFEMKHYKGTIYGKTSDQKWTQYFRTAPNSHFYNPILQNQYHIQALRKMLVNVPVYSLVVFTSPECDLRVESSDSETIVCRIDSLSQLFFLMEKRNKLFDIEQIDEIFNKLISFSPVATKVVTVNEETIPFHQYINAIVHDFSEERDKANKAICEAKKNEQKKTITTIIAAAVAIVVCVVLSVCSCAIYREYADRQIDTAERELSEFAQKFESVPAFNNGNLAFANDLVSVSNIVIERSTDIKNSVAVSFKLTHTGTDYGIFINQDTAITIILKDGAVKESKVFNEKYPYKSNAYLGNYTLKESAVLPHEFYNTVVDDIAYIKLTNVGVWTRVSSQRKTVSTTYEIEIYKAK